jgi:hypothetical protein
METENDSFVEANLGETLEALRIWASGMQSPLHFSIRDYAYDAKPHLSRYALNQRDYEYCKAAKTHSFSSSLSLGRNGPMRKYKYG